MNKKATTYLNIFGFCLVVLINALANILPINGHTTGEVSGYFPNLFVPAGITFSIWSLIYLFMGLFALAPLKGKQKSSNVGFHFFIACIANVMWLLSWHYMQIGLSLLIMFFLLFELIKMYELLGIGKKEISVAGFWKYHVFVSLYLGWISIATVANITVFLIDSGFSPSIQTEIHLTCAVIAIAALLGIFMLIKRKDIVYAIVLIWAFSGIILKRYEAEEVYYSIISIASTSIVILVIMIGFQYKKWVRIWYS